MWYWRERARLGRRQSIPTSNTHEGLPLLINKPSQIMPYVSSKHQVLDTRPCRLCFTEDCFGIRGVALVI